MGESGRTFGKRYKEHLRGPLPIQGHQMTSYKLTTMENFNIIGREENCIARTIKESHLYQGQPAHPK